MKDAARFVIVIGAILVGIWAVDIARDRMIDLVVVSDAPVYAISPIENQFTNRKIAVLHPGQAVRVLRSRGGKDFIAYQIETESGLRGWVYLGDGVKRSVRTASDKG